MSYWEGLPNTTCALVQPPKILLVFLGITHVFPENQDVCGTLVRGGTDLTGFSPHQEGIRGSIANLFLYHSYEVGKVQFCKQGTMETPNDSSGVTQETCGGESKGNQTALPKSPTCPLTSSLPSGTHWGVVGQGIVGALNSLRQWSFPSYTGWGVDTGVTLLCSMGASSMSYGASTEPGPSLGLGSQNQLDWKPWRSWSPAYQFPDSISSWSTFGGVEWEISSPAPRFWNGDETHWLCSIHSAQIP